MEDITKHAEKRLNEGTDKLREGLERARKQGVDVVENAFPIADEAIEKAKAKGEAIWEKAKTTGQDLLNDVEAGGQKVFGQVKTYVQKRPVQALGYAILAGLIAGVVISAKSRES